MSTNNDLDDLSMPNGGLDQIETHAIDQGTLRCDVARSWPGGGIFFTYLRSHVPTRTVKMLSNALEPILKCLEGSGQATELPKAEMELNTVFPAYRQPRPAPYTGVQVLSDKLRHFGRH
jgi:hypothetical protein